MTSTTLTKVVDWRPPFNLETDVLVVGGGAAGVAAAVTAARHGARVVLLERYGFCGGGAVAGLSGTICGLYEASDNAADQPRQLVFGFADEFAKLLSQRSGLTPPIRYGKTFTRVHDPLVWREAADHLLRTAGVVVSLHTTVTEVLLDGGDRIAGVVAYTKQGKLAVRAKITVDASGDADLAEMAGLGTHIGDNGLVQNPTMMFRLSGVDIPRFLDRHGKDSIMDQDVTDAIHKVNQRGEVTLPRSKVFLFETPRPNELLCNATRLIGFDGRELNPVVAADLTEAEFQGRLQVREYEKFFKQHIAGCESAYINDTGAQVGVRQTRQINGVERLTNVAIAAGEKRSDGIARCPWPIELHSGEKPKLNWLFRDYYEVPYGCFVPNRGESLLAAGRCLSAEHEAVASARVTAQCFSYGHAVGIAAATSALEKVQPRSLHGEDLRARLNRENAGLD